MSFQRVLKLAPFRFCLYRLAKWRVVEKLDQLKAHLNLNETILDVGSGNCVLCSELKRRNYHITALDVDNLGFIDDIEPIVYDGILMPFDDGSFDVALLITVLHHTKNPETVLLEAM